MIVNFKEDQAKLDKIPGWFQLVNHAVFTCLLDYQLTHNIKGHLGEFGVYQGKSAVPLAKYTAVNEELYLVDPFTDVIGTSFELIRSNIAKVLGYTPSNIKAYTMRSEELELSYEKNKYIQHTRFLHIDGHHTSESVMNDLSFAYKLLQSDGIVVVDDVYVAQYPQVTEALYHYMFLHPGQYRLFMICGVKAYLCRPEAYTPYYYYVMTQLQNELKAIGVDVTILKTSGIGDCYTLGVREYFEHDTEHIPNNTVLGLHVGDDLVECPVQYSHKVGATVPANPQGKVTS